MSDEQKLVGKVIASVSIVKHSKGCDSENVLVLTMKTGEVFHIEGGYGGYTGGSCDEYVETIGVQQVKP